MAFGYGDLSPGTGTGVTDHGALSGLGDDDHAQYHTNARALAWLNARSNTDLVNYAEGTRAGQPAAGNAGHYYYVTDENVLERDNGTAWVPQVDKAHRDNVTNPHGVTAAQVGAAPSAHAAQHASGGADPVSPASIGAAPSTHAAQHASGGADPVSPGSIGAALVAHEHTSADIDSEAATDGHVLTADGLGGSAFEVVPAGGAASQLDANGTVLDVNVITDGEFLKRVGTTVVSDVAGGGASSLNDLTDVDLATVAPVSGDVIKFDGSLWVPAVDDTGGGTGSIFNVPAGFTQADLRNFLNDNKNVSGTRAFFKKGTYTGEDIASLAGRSFSGAHFEGMDWRNSIIQLPAAATLPLLDISGSGSQFFTWGGMRLEANGNSDLDAIVFNTTVAFPMDFGEFFKMQAVGFRHVFHIMKGVSATRIENLATFANDWVIYFDGEEIADLIITRCRFEGSGSYDRGFGGMFVDLGRTTDSKPYTSFKVDQAQFERMSRPGFCILHGSSGSISGVQLSRGQSIFGFGSSRIVADRMLIAEAGHIADVGWGNVIRDSGVTGLLDRQTPELHDSDMFYPLPDDGTRPAGTSLIAAGMMVEPAVTDAGGSAGSGTYTEWDNRYARAGGGGHYARKITGGSAEYRDFAIPMADLVANSWYMVDLVFDGRARVQVLDDGGAVIADTDPTNPNAAPAQYVTSQNLWEWMDRTRASGVGRAINANLPKRSFIHFATGTVAADYTLRLFGNTTGDPAYLRFQVHQNLLENPTFGGTYSLGVPSGWNVIGTGASSKEVGTQLFSDGSLRIDLDDGENVTVEPANTNLFDNAFRRYNAGFVYRVTAEVWKELWWRAGVGFQSNQRHAHHAVYGSIQDVWLVDSFDFTFDSGDVKAAGTTVSQRLQLIDSNGGWPWTAGETSAASGGIIFGMAWLRKMSPNTADPARL